MDGATVDIFFFQSNPLSIHVWDPCTTAHWTFMHAFLINSNLHRHKITRADLHRVINTLGQWYIKYLHLSSDVMAHCICYDLSRHCAHLHPSHSLPHLNNPFNTQLHTICHLQLLLHIVCKMITVRWLAVSLSSCYISAHLIRIIFMSSL